MKNQIKDLRNQILPLLFSINFTYWASSLYMGYFIIGTLIASVILHSLFFIWYKYLYKKKSLGGIYFIISSIMYISITLAINSSVKLVYRTTFFEWVSMLKANGTFIMGYWLSGVMLMTFFFSVTVFYFSVISFRMPILLLISIIPLSIQTLMKDNAVNFPFINFLVLFLLLYMEHTRIKISNKDLNHHINNKWYLQAKVIFLSLTLLLALLIPKPNTIPKIANLDVAISKIAQPFLNGNSSKNSNSNNFNDLNGESDISSTRIPTSTRVIFEIQAEEPLYLISKSFDNYKNNHWVTAEKPSVYSLVKTDLHTSQVDLNAINPLLEKIYKNTEGKDEIEQILNANSIPQEIKSAQVITKGYQMKCFLSLPGLIKIDRATSNGEIYLNENENFVLAKNRNLQVDEEYNIRYISQTINPKSREFQFLKYTNEERYISLLNLKVNKSLGLSNNELDFAYDNYTRLPADITDRTINLANKITAGQVSDYDKAVAIEKFFYSSNFKYGTTTQKAPDGLDYNDFFLFESKKGICVQFASAMVILARANGLPARYVEGYKVDEKDKKSGKYIVREKDGHAFPEIYIAGYGWKVFEPTISSGGSNWGLNELFSYNFNRLKNVPIYVKIFFIPICVLIIMLFIHKIISIRYNRWKKKILKAKGKDAIKEIFARTNSLLMKINYDKKGYETPTNYALRIFDESGLELDNLVNVFNKSKYGGIEPSREEIAAALRNYEEILVLVKNRISKLKAWII